MLFVCLYISSEHFQLKEWLRCQKFMYFEPCETNNEAIHFYCKSNGSTLIVFGQKLKTIFYEY